MQLFPAHKLIPESGRIWGAPNAVSIEIPFQPFEIDELTIETSLRLDGIMVPSSHLAELAGQSFGFPVNPIDGYIDGSMYLEHAHHPVDVTQLAFDNFGADDFGVRLQANFVLGYEGFRDFEDFSITLSCGLTRVAA